MVKPGVAEVRVSCAIVAAMDVVAYVVDMVVGSFWCCVLILHFDTRSHKKKQSSKHTRTAPGLIVASKQIGQLQGVYAAVGWLFCQIPSADGPRTDQGRLSNICRIPCG